MIFFIWTFFFTIVSVCVLFSITSQNIWYLFIVWRVDQNTLVLFKEEEDDDAPGSAFKRKTIRKILKEKKLGDATKTAAKDEDERRTRIKERQKLVRHTFYL